MKNKKNAIFNKINVENIDNEYNFLYSKFSSYCISRIKKTGKIINKNDLKKGDILISPYLFFKSQNIIESFNFNEYDIIVFCENPIIDILDAYKIPKDVKPSYDTRLIGFNDKNLMEWWKTGKTDEELYDYCKQNNYKVKTMFSNIMVKEKMKMFGVQWIIKDIRKKHEKDIINFFNKNKEDH